jgi:hypothetical protein
VPPVIIRKAVEFYRRSKYRSQGVRVDGVWFASVKEANRWCTLTLLQRGGHLTRLERQVHYALHTVAMGRAPAPDVHVERVGFYVADFVYHDASGVLVVEDVKGFPTDLYRWKKRHFELEYGVTITEI